MKSTWAPAGMGETLAARDGCRHLLIQTFKYLLKSHTSFCCIRRHERVEVVPLLLVIRLLSFFRLVVLGHGLHCVVPQALRDSISAQGVFLGRGFFIARVVGGVEHGTGPLLEGSFLPFVFRLRGDVGSAPLSSSKSLDISMMEHLTLYSLY